MDRVGGDVFGVKTALQRARAEDDGFFGVAVAFPGREGAFDVGEVGVLEGHSFFGEERGGIGGVGGEVDDADARGG